MTVTVQLIKVLLKQFCKSISNNLFAKYVEAKTAQIKEAITCYGINTLNAIIQ